MMVLVIDDEGVVIDNGAGCYDVGYVDVDDGDAVYK